MNNHERLGFSQAQPVSLILQPAAGLEAVRRSEGIPPVRQSSGSLNGQSTCCSVQKHNDRQLPALTEGKGVGMDGSTAPSAEYHLLDRLNEFLNLIDARHEAFLRSMEKSMGKHIDKSVEKALKKHFTDFTSAMNLSAEMPPEVSQTGSLKNPSAIPLNGPLNGGGFPASKAVQVIELPASDAENEDGPKPGCEEASEPQSPTLHSQKGEASKKSMDIQLAQGYMIENVKLEIVEAQGLMASDFGWGGGTGTSDPYAKVVFGEQGEVYKTRTHYKTLNPVWNACCRFEVIDEDADIVVEVYDRDQVASDDLLGRVILPMSELKEDGTKEISKWFDLLPDEEECPDAKGRIYLRASLKRFEATDEIAYFRLQRWEVEHSKTQEILYEGTEPPPKSKPGQKRDIPCVKWFQALVASKRFDVFFCLVIAFNAVVMLIELEYFGRKSQSLIGLAEKGANESEALEFIFKILNYFFTVIFVIELICRLAAHGYKYLVKPANWLDIVIVGGSVLDVVELSVGVNLTFLRLVRLVKLGRLLKAALMSPFCEPLRVLMKAISSSFPSLLWSFLLLAMVEVVAALFMTQVLAEAIQDESRDLDVRKFIYTHYGTTSRTTLTMFQITMAAGSWAIVGRPIIEEVSPVFAWFFIMYVGGVTFAIMRIITALFLRNTIQVATKDEQLMRNEKAREKAKFSEEQIRDLFIELAGDGTGRVSLDQFREFLIEEQGQTWLKILELDEKDAASIFQLVSDGAGRLTLDEFLSGVFKLKDTTKQIDMVVLQHEVKKIGKLVKRINLKIKEEIVDEIAAQIHRRQSMIAPLRNPEEPAI